MNIDSEKYTSLLSNIETEFLIRLEEYAEFYVLSRLEISVGQDVKDLVSRCLLSLEIEEGMTIDPVTPSPAKIAIEAGARKAVWLFKECDFTSRNKRLIVCERENEVLCELLKTLDILKQLQDLK